VRTFSETSWDIPVTRKRGLDDGFWKGQLAVARHSSRFLMARTGLFSLQWSFCLIMSPFRPSYWPAWTLPSLITRCPIYVHFLATFTLMWSLAVVVGWGVGEWWIWVFADWSRYLDCDWSLVSPSIWNFYSKHGMIRCWWLEFRSHDRGLIFRNVNPST